MQKSEKNFEKLKVICLKSDDEKREKQLRKNTLPFTWYCFIVIGDTKGSGFSSTFGIGFGFFSMEGDACGNAGIDGILALSV